MHGCPSHVMVGRGSGGKGHQGKTTSNLHTSLSHAASSGKTLKSVFDFLTYSRETQFSFSNGEDKNLKGSQLSNVKKIIESLHGDKCNVQALHFQMLTNLTLNHDGRLQVQHDISETDIASLYKGERASMKFEVVCFLSNALRYWPETKAS